MGILNLTPDSFFDGGHYTLETTQLNRAEQMLLEGADIIDLGAVSTRPGAAEVTEQEEAERLFPALSRIRKEFNDVLISVDTFRSGIAQRAVDSGADMINDISSGHFDAAMKQTVARLNVPYIMMHILGTPSTMQIDPHYDDVTEDILDFFRRELVECAKSGIQKTIIDPGFGFGKTVQHNYRLLSDLHRFTELNVPVLVGLSRKSMIYKILGINNREALNGTTALNTVALMKGASILRVHDVKEAAEVVKLVSLITK